jgi:hypothetical protein
VYQAIEEPFIVAVREALGDRFTSRVESIYRKTIKFILSTLTTGFEHRDQSQSQGQNGDLHASSSSNGLVVADRSEDITLQEQK